MATFFLTPRHIPLLKNCFRRLPALTFRPMATGYFADDETRAERVRDLFDKAKKKVDERGKGEGPLG